MSGWNKISYKNKLGLAVLVGLVAVTLIGVVLLNRSQYEPQTYRFYNTLPDMAIGGTVERSVEHARDIVYGQYTGYVKEVVEAAYRGEVYTFQVEKALLGDTAGEIQVMITSRFIVSQTVDDNIFTTGVKLPHYVEPDFSKRYMLILDYNENQDVYLSPLTPNHIEFNDEVALLKYNTDSVGIAKNDRGDQAIFTMEEFDLPEDSITGLSKDEVFKQFKAEIAKKQTQPKE